MISPELIFDIGQTFTNERGRILLKEPQRSYMWEAYILDPKPRGGDEVKLYMISGFVPASTNEPIRGRFMGQQYANTGYETSMNVFTTTLWDDDTLFSYRYMQEWINQINDPVAGRNAGRAAKRDLVLITKNKFDNRATGTFSLIGCYPTELAAAPLDYSNSSNFTFDVTLVFDHKFMNDTAESYRFDE